MRPLVVLATGVLVRVEVEVSKEVTKGDRMSEGRSFQGKEG